MKTLVALEELAQVAAVVVLLVLAGVPWWVYPLLLVGPDISMVGYLAGPRAGAFSYNLFHHKGVALALILASGLLAAGASTDFAMGPLLVAGLVLYGHSSLDRLLGYGLKYSDSFNRTHLGWIGKGAKAASGASGDRPA